MTAETTHLLTGLKAMAEETRWKLILLLLNGQWCGKALARRLGISEAAVSQHLKILKGAGLVEGEKRGYWVHYSVKREALEKIIGELRLILFESEMPAGPCRRLQPKNKGEEAELMCKSCCEKPIKLKEKAEKCTPEQIKECHGDDKGHPCVPKKDK